MDWTQGFFQAPLSKSARIYTAFITFMGIFKYLRVPMGPKGAPAYFQSMMATIVIYTVCELYMDDILIYAQTQNEYLTRLRLGFDRFRKHKLTANPKKCWFGLTECEFVGRELSEKGISMTKLKKSFVVDFPLPRVGNELKSFIGLVNYYRDHLRDIPYIIKPLKDLLRDYDKVRHRKITWTVETRIAFATIQQDG
jgi:hypothetical protein